MLLILGALVVTATVVIVKAVISPEFREVWHREGSDACPWRGGADD
jgi:hypothetical protein